MGEYLYMERAFLAKMSLEVIVFNDTMCVQGFF